MTNQTRASQERINHTKDSQNTGGYYSMDYPSPISIPHGVKKEGFVYRWVNADLSGGNATVDDALMRGYDYVLKDRAPMRHKTFNTSKYGNEYIPFKDCILMEAPDKIIREESIWMNNKSNKVMQGISQYVRDDIPVNINYPKSVHSF